ncbi:hypothetical protein G6M50_17455 [Agrobacterium rhizogenes]|nr:hypothetical protein [Rhizobium rhizogenes]NTJ79568.1 hypothetical protein [Rhizobium rhizogenes]
MADAAREAFYGKVLARVTGRGNRRRQEGCRPGDCGIGRSTGSGKRLEGWRGAWSAIRRMELPTVCRGFGFDHILAHKRKMVAHFSRWMGQERCGRNPAGLAAHHMGLAVLLAVSRLFGGADDGQASIRQAVLRKFQRR